MNFRARRTSRNLVLPLLLCGLAFTSAGAQTAAKPLPSNYKTTFENADVIVMRVHYGPHEFVPMHDHSAFPTVYVYLNDSGVIRITHAPPTSFSVERPPTHTGAFRISPSMIERHSITNLSDIPSDFLRVELKTIPLTDLKQTFRGPAPTPTTPGAHTEFHDADLSIDRIVCPPENECSPSPTKKRSLLIAITPIHLQTPEGNRMLHPGDVLWSQAGIRNSLRLNSGAQALLISLLYPE